MPTPCPQNLPFLFPSLPAELCALSSEALAAMLLGREDDKTPYTRMRTLLCAISDGPNHARGPDATRTQRLAAIELGRRAAHQLRGTQAALQGPADLVALARSRKSPASFGGWGFALDDDLRVQRIYHVTSLESNSLVDSMRAWLLPGLACEAHYLGFAFCVATGELAPSAAQLRSLRIIARQASRWGTTLLDCVRWNDMGFHSCSTLGLLPPPRPARR